LIAETSRSFRAQLRAFRSDRDGCLNDACCRSAPVRDRDCVTSISGAGSLEREALEQAGLIAESQLGWALTGAHRSSLNPIVARVGGSPVLFIVCNFALVRR